MKGIILAGGTGTRLYPITKALSKQLIPIYDKPMIYYPLATLISGGIQDILIICNSEDLFRFQKLFQDGSSLGIKLSYMIQDKPNGIAEAFTLGREFIGNDSVTLILGDNIFYNDKMGSFLKNAIRNNKGSTIFGYEVENPSRFGVIEFDKNNKVISLEEKPFLPKSNYACTGIYIFDNKVISIAEKLKPSARGELEITDAINVYLKNNSLTVGLMDKTFDWIDTGTIDSLFHAIEYVKNMKELRDIYVGCIEELAYKEHFINKKELKSLANEMSKTEYGIHLANLLKEDIK